MNTEVSKGKDTIPEEKTVTESQQSPEVKEKDITEVNLTEIQERVVKLEGIMERLLKRIDLKDEPVKIPPKSNYNPDYLPTQGGEPKTLDELPPRKG